MDLSLGFLFCSIDLYFCLCASTILSWWLWLCSRAWSQADWFLQFHSSFSRLLWLFEVFCISIQINEIICSSSVKKYLWYLDCPLSSSLINTHKLSMLWYLKEWNLQSECLGLNCSAISWLCDLNKLLTCPKPWHLNLEMKMTCHLFHDIGNNRSMRLGN